MEVMRTAPAQRAAVYRAFVDPDALAAWLPPAGMRAELHAFEAREGGGYRMSLVYEDAAGPPGKTTADTDVVQVRFVELVPDVRIVQAVRFESEDAAYGGVMTMTWTFEDAPGGTLVRVRVDNPPPGIRDEDHEAGIRSSLENLAAFVRSANP